MMRARMVVIPLVAVLLFVPGVPGLASTAFEGFRVVDGVAVSASTHVTTPDELRAYLESESPKTVTVDIETGRTLRVIDDQDLPESERFVPRQYPDFPGLSK